MSTNPYDDFLKQAYTSGLSNVNNKSNDLWEQLKSSASQNNQLSQNYSKTVNDYLNSIQSDKQAVTSRVDDLTSTIKSDKSMLHGKYDKLEDYQYNHNPYTSDIGQSILANFKWQGKNASDNAVADSSASNGGNIDSFAAANSARQQMAFDVAGHNAALNDFNTRTTGIQQTLRDLGNYNLGTYDATNRGIESIVSQNNNGYAASGKALDNLYNSNLASQAQSSSAFNNYMQLLGFMGDQTQQVFNNGQTYNQQLFDNNQTALNNQVNRDVVDSQITGNVPLGSILRNSTYFDTNGNLRNGGEGTNFAEIINKLTADLEQTSDPVERQKIQNQLVEAQIARNYKIQTNPAYAAYANTMESYALPESSYTKQTNADRTYQEWAAKMGLDYNLEALASNERVNNANNAGAMDRLQMQIGADTSMNNAKLELEYYKANQQKDNGNNSDAKKPIMSLAQADKEVQEGRITDAAIETINYYHQDPSAFEKWYLPTIKETMFDDFILSGNISTGASQYVKDKLKGKTIDESKLKDSIVSDSAEYGFGVEDAREIYKNLYPNLDSSWLDNYRNPQNVQANNFLNGFVYNITKGKVPVVSQGINEKGIQKKKQ